MFNWNRIRVNDLHGDALYESPRHRDWSANYGEEEARRLVKEARGLGWEPQWGAMEVYPVKPAAWEVSGGS